MMLELTLNSFRIACRLLQRVHAWTRASGPLTSPMKGSSSPVTLSGLPLALLARGLISKPLGKRQLIGAGSAQVRRYRSCARRSLPEVFLG